MQELNGGNKTVIFKGFLEGVWVNVLLKRNHTLYIKISYRSKVLIQFKNHIKYYWERIIM